MSKGIRTFAKALFVELSAKRIAGEFGPIDTYLGAGNTAFRKAITDAIEAKFDVKISSSATAYNYAKVWCTKNHPELVVGLGRPEDKKGGRKPNAVAATAPVSEAAPVVTEQASDAAASAAAPAKQPTRKARKSQQAQQVAA